MASLAIGTPVMGEYGPEEETPPTPESPEEAFSPPPRTERPFEAVAAAGG